MKNNSRRQNNFVWPCFVDALSALLLVFVLLLLLFILSQTFLSNTKSKHAQQLSGLQGQIQKFENALKEEKKNQQDLIAGRQSLISKLDKSLLEQKYLTQSLEEIEKNKMIDKQTIKVLEQQILSELARKELDKKKIDALRNKMEILEQQYVDLKSVSQATSDQLNTRKNTLHNKLEDISRKLSDTQSELTNEQKNKLKLQSDFNSYKEKQTQIIASLQEDKKSLWIERDKDRGTIDQLKVELKSKEHDIKQLSQNISMAGNLRAEKENAQGVIDNLKQDNAALQQAIAEVNSTYNEQKQLIKDLTANLEKSEQIIKDNSVSNQVEIDKIDNKYKAVVTEKEKLSQKVDDITKNIQKISSENNVLKQTLSNREKDLLTLKRQSQLTSGLSQEQADAVQQLEKQISDFKSSEGVKFNRIQDQFIEALEKSIGNGSGVSINQNRVLFKSEILFGSGSSELDTNGKSNLNPIIQQIKSISKDLPDDVDWVLRVDGHTDIIPIGKTSKFKSNVHLSAERARSVVEYMVSQGIDKKRLVPAGFGANFPITEGYSDDAHKKNRRIELKMTIR